MDVQQMEVDDAEEDQYADDGNRQLFKAWRRLKNNLELIYANDQCVDINFLFKCYEEVYEYVMHVNKEQIELRNMGKQEFHPGRTQEISRELYYCLIGFMNDKTEEFKNVIMKQFDTIASLLTFFYS
jgi:hypothetical protein